MYYSHTGVALAHNPLPHARSYLPSESVTTYYWGAQRHEDGDGVGCEDVFGAAPDCAGGKISSSLSDA